MNNTKRVIIHTGPGKTGSSAIQAWLVKNIALLESNSIFYPKHDLSKDKISSGNLREILTQADNGTWQVDSKKVTNLLLNFEKSGHSTLLLSSEFFFHRIIDIQKLIPHAEFIAYIRNPVELLESNYNQSVKRHSNIKPFIAPPELDSFLWQYLERVFKNVDSKKIHLRPFDERLMQGGNIVADMLCVLGMSLDDGFKNSRINPSFTFESLEFKRLLNHFGLGSIEPKLDVALQSCDIGDREYSLIAPEIFNKLNNESCEKMASFIELYNQPHLLPLLNIFKDVKQRTFVKQRASLSQLTLISDYLLEYDSALHAKLISLIKSNPNLVIDTPAIYELYGVEHEAIDKKMLIDDLLLKHINQFTVHPSKRGKICYELACYYFQLGDFDNALKFAKGAHYFNPKNWQFIDKLNELIRAVNQNIKDASAAEVIPEKKSAIRKFKSLLGR